MSKSYESFAKRLGEFSQGQCTAVPSVAETHEFIDYLFFPALPVHFF